MHKKQTKAERARIARQMRAVTAKAPTFVIADCDGNCFANVIINSGQFRYTTRPACGSAMRTEMVGRSFMSSPKARSSPTMTWSVVTH